MRDTHTILGLIHERGKKGLPLERVQRLLYNPDLYLTAYGKLYRNKGSLTKGTTEETVEGMSLDTIETIIKAWRDGTFQWKPARRTYIPKKDGNKRPLGLPDWPSKLVQEVIRLILNAYYEPQFSEHSHGFRPERGCHTALREVKKWDGTTWFTEGDISKCFDKLDHQILPSILSESIHDGLFIKLMSELLEAGYLEKWKFHTTLSGTPQGGVVSPLLANIYLDRLDTYVERELLPEYNRGKRRKGNPTYERLAAKARYARKQGRTEEARLFRQQMQHRPSQDPNETHARTEKARFLGYEVQVLHNDRKQTKGRRSVNAQIGFRVPKDVILEKCRDYTEEGRPIHRPELLKESVFTISSTYQAEYRGLVEYYRMAHDLSLALPRLKWDMERSLIKTLAAKLQIAGPQVYKRYQATIIVEGKPYKGLRTTIEREGKKPLVAEWGGIPLIWNIKATLNDQPERVWSTRSELEERLLADTCEYCGAMGKCQVHHVRALKDLQVKGRRPKPRWMVLMAARQRKTMVVCRTCHEDITHGRPMRRQEASTGFMHDEPVASRRKRAS